MTTTEDRPLGREIVIAAFVAAPNRTLTNHELGALRGVQAFHQRMSDNKRRGFVFTESVKVAAGCYAYRLLGASIGSDAAHERSGLPIIENVTQAIARGTQSLKEHPPTPPRAGHARTADPVAVHAAEAVNASRDELDAVNIARGRAEAEVTGLKGDIASAVEALARVLNDGDEHHVQVDPKATTLPGIVELVEDVIATLRERTRTPARAPRARREVGGSDRMTGPKAMAAVLEAEARPMHSKLIAERVISQHPDLYGGKTPAATMAAQMATSNVKGGEFVKVAPGCFGLRTWDGAKLGLEPTR